MKTKATQEVRVDAGAASDFVDTDVINAATPAIRSEHEALLGGAPKKGATSDRRTTSRPPNVAEVPSAPSKVGRTTLSLSADMHEVSLRNDAILMQFMKASALSASESAGTVSSASDGGAPRLPYARDGHPHVDRGSAVGRLKDLTERLAAVELKKMRIDKEAWDVGTFRTDCESLTAKIQDLEIDVRSELDSRQDDAEAERPLDDKGRERIRAFEVGLSVLIARTSKLIERIARSGNPPAARNQIAMACAAANAVCLALARAKSTNAPFQIVADRSLALSGHKASDAPRQIEMDVDAASGISPQQRRADFQEAYNIGAELARVITIQSALGAIHHETCENFNLMDLAVACGGISVVLANSLTLAATDPDLNPKKRSIAIRTDVSATEDVGAFGEMAERVEEGLRLARGQDSLFSDIVALRQVAVMAVSATEDMAMALTGEVAEMSEGASFSNRFPADHPSRAPSARQAATLDLIATSFSELRGQVMHERAAAANVADEQGERWMVLADLLEHEECRCRLSASSIQPSVPPAPKGPANRRAIRERVSSTSAADATKASPGEPRSLGSVSTSEARQVASTDSATSTPLKTTLAEDCSRLASRWQDAEAALKLASQQILAHWRRTNSFHRSEHVSQARTAWANAKRLVSEARDIMMAHPERAAQLQRDPMVHGAKLVKLEDQLTSTDQQITEMHAYKPFTTASLLAALEGKTMTILQGSEDGPRILCDKNGPFLDMKLRWADGSSVGGHTRPELRMHIHLRSDCIVTDPAALQAAHFSAWGMPVNIKRSSQLYLTGPRADKLHVMPADYERVLVLVRRAAQPPAAATKAGG